MTLKYMKPYRLYKKMADLKMNAIVLDGGDKVAGISVANLSEGVSRPIPWLASCKSNFRLSAVESVVQECFTGLGDCHYLNRLVFPENLIVPQVLKLEDMKGAEVREVIDATARLNNVGCIFFGLSADIRSPFDPENYTFIKKLIDLLDKEGVMLPFCFVNEYGSTKLVKPKIRKQYPWLTDVDQFVDKYPNIKDFECCLDRGDLWFQMVKFLKGLTDCYAAVDFSHVFMDKCSYKKLITNGVSRKARRIIDLYVTHLGLEESDDDV